MSIITKIYKKQVDRLIKQGLLEWVESERERIRLTRRGRLLGNQVFMQFVGEDRDQETITRVPMPFFSQSPFSMTGVDQR